MEQVIESIEQINLYHALAAIIVIDYLLGVTNRYHSNSILEAVLRSIGWLFILIFRPKSKKMAKLRGRKR